MSMDIGILEDPKHHRYVLNMGPQHPSTHGVLRVLLELEGEYAMNLLPVLGYGHRCHEKIAEYKPVKAFMPNTARMDYLGALIYNHGYALLLERAVGIEVPERVEYIRVITSELNRIQSHLLWYGAYLLDLGAFTPALGADVVTAGGADQLAAYRNQAKAGEMQVRQDKLAAADAQPAGADRDVIDRRPGIAAAAESQFSRYLDAGFSDVHRAVRADAGA